MTSNTTIAKELVLCRLAIDGLQLTLDSAIDEIEPGRQNRTYLALLDQATGVNVCSSEQTRLLNRLVSSKGELSKLEAIGLNADVASLRMLIAEAALAVEPLIEAVRDLVWRGNPRRARRVVQKLHDA
jgi:hypothetical protein